MDDDQQFCLRWNNHQSTLVAVFDTLLENGTLVDCTLAAEGKFLNAHKVVLSACSPYFEQLLSKHFDKHPILILKDVKFQELKAMMDYMYRGEVNISQDQLGALLKAAESLQIKGLSDNRKGETERKPAPAPPPPKSPQPTSVIPKVQGLTIEQRGRDDSREGSMSPGPRKKKRLRRKSEELDNHDASNSSESHSLPAAQNIPTLPAVTKMNADVPEQVETKSEILTRHIQLQQTDEMPKVPIIKEKIETHTELMLEPKSEYVDEMNEDSIEDLTLDDDDLSNMEQMDDGAGPSHGNTGEGSSQGFGGWHMGNQSQDEVFLAAQEAVGAHRDSQGEFWTERKCVFSTSSLEELLGKNPDGHFVLQKKRQLDNSSRQKLVKIIVDDLIIHHQNNNKFPILLHTAAQEIIKLFPQERIETYFIPYSKDAGTAVKNPARGKLYSRWVNLKRALTLAKDVTPPEGKTRPATGTVLISDVEIDNFNLLLHSNERSFEDIKKAWKASFQLRRQKLKARESPLSYFDLFPGLKQTFGYQLLVEDFNMLYPKSANISIYEYWPKIGSCIIDMLKQKNSQLPELESMLIDLHVKSLKVFPYLFTPCVLHTKFGNKKRIKFPRTVMAERFFSIIPNFEDLETKILERKENLKDFGVALQPYMIAVGHPHNILAYFVVLGNQRYLVKDCLAALDTCFKIYHALNLPYSAENFPVWQCIDYLIYGINKSVKPAASVVIGEIEQKLKNMNV